MYDIAASSLVDTVKAHSNTLWSMQVRSDEQVLVTGSADKDVKFWELKQETSENVCMVTTVMRNFLRPLLGAKDFEVNTCTDAEVDGRSPICTV